jgi:hypothetical protein
MARIKVPYHLWGEVAGMRAVGPADVWCRPVIRG